MTKSIQIVWFFISMVVAVGGGSFAVFKWIDKQQDTDKDTAKELALQRDIHRQDSIWMEELLQSLEVTRAKVDSTILLSRQNIEATAANREVLTTYIERDSSITGPEMIKILEPFMQELKKNCTWIPSACEYYSTEVRGSLYQ